MYQILLIVHIIAASIWVGVHLYLFVRLMPRFVRNQDVAAFLQFEKSYEPLGLLALAVQVITGVYMLNAMVPMSQWLAPLGQLGGLIYAKLFWLLLTIITALHARLRVVARFEKGVHDAKTMRLMMVHVGLICLWAIAFVVTGVAFRFG